MLKNAGWILSANDGVSFVGMGDSVAGTCNLLLGVHLSCMPKVDPIELKQPPPVPPQPIAQYLWEPFNRPEHSVCFGRDDADFCRQDVRFTASDPPDGTPIPPGVIVKYYIHGHGLDESILCGSAVVAVDSMCAHLMPMQIRTCFDIFSVWSFITKIIPMLGRYHRSSLLGALALLIR